MRSIQTKLIALMMAGIFLASVLVGGIGLWFAVKTLEKELTITIDLTSSSDAAIIDRMLDSVEQGVHTLAHYAIESADDINTITDKERRDAYTKEVEKVMLSVADNVLDSVSVYIRYAPEITTISEGMFYVRNGHGEAYHQEEITDIAKYDPDDTEHVGWYYIPKEKGEPVWIEPYTNKNIDVNMISYVIPMYKDGHFIGVVGMDIDFNCIIREIKSISVYDTGYAFLVNSQGEVMYHKDAESGNISFEPDTAEKIRMIATGENGGEPLDYQRNGRNKKMYGTKLSNGMTLIITAPVSEINKDIWSLAIKKVSAMAGVLILFVFLITWCVRSFVRPIKELSAAAQRITSGDLNINVKNVKSRDEVGELAASMRVTVNHLREYIDYIQGMAYKDTLTGVKSNASYLHDVKELDEELKKGEVEFTVAMADINGLKKVNDTYGHDRGDKLIKNAAFILCEVFSKDNIYRMGGDEFVAILRGEQSRDYEEYMSKLKRLLAERNEYAADESEIVSIACGAARFDSSRDTCYADVFKRADQLMYENKSQLKKE